MLSSQILNDAINLDFSKNYIVEFPLTLLNKSKKTNRFLNALDNPLIKTKVSIKFNYKTYLENKSVIDNIINLGFNVALELDESFDNNFDSLILFSYVLVYDYLDYYDIIIDSRDTIKTTIIAL